MNILYVVLSILAVVAVIGGIWVLLNNNAIRKHERVLQTFSDIDIILIQRNDQVNQQLNLLGQTLQTESKVYKDIAKYRSGINEYSNMSINDKVEFNNQLSAFIMGGLRPEAYPELTSLTSTLTSVLQTWNAVEIELKVKRLAYNRSATLFNTGLKTFPDKYFFTKARMLGSEDGTVEPFKLIKASEQEKQAVSIPTPLWGQ